MALRAVLGNGGSESLIGFRRERLFLVGSNNSVCCILAGRIQEKGAVMVQKRKDCLGAVLEWVRSGSRPTHDDLAAGRPSLNLGSGIGGVQ